MKRFIIQKNLVIFMAIGFEINLQNSAKGFYTDNIGKAVNLFGDNLTLSGDLSFFDELKGNIILNNYVHKKFNPDGTSCFWENPGEFEISALKILGRELSTREDRLGRIAKYNRDLMVEELEHQKKLEDLSKPGLVEIFSK